MTREYDDKVLNYIADLYAPEDALLQEVRAEGERRWAGMQVSAVEGKLLATLVHLRGAKRILELGTFMGYSTLWMARALTEGGEIITCERQEDHAEQAQLFFDKSEVTDRITLMQGDALASIAQLTGYFDMLFIDAEKKAYAAYLDALEPMLKTGGLIIGDNTLLFGAMVDPDAVTKQDHAVSVEAKDAMSEFNQRLADPTQYQSIMLPTQEGMTIAMKL